MEPMNAALLNITLADTQADTNHTQQTSGVRMKNHRINRISHPQKTAQSLQMPEERTKRRRKSRMSSFFLL